MDIVTEGTLLWQPSATVIERTNLRRYMTWLEQERGLAFQTYQELWLWSVTDLDAFWENIWQYFEIEASRPYTRVLGDRSMPGRRH